MNYQDALDFLYPLHRFGIKPGLERVYRLLDCMGSPQRRMGMVIHIAGTNGKGTVAGALASIFQASGKKTALYTSPHLVDFTERMRIDGAQIPREKVAYYCSQLKEAALELQSTFFEVTTALAFAWFADEGVEVSVIETGMGGRLDATNVVESNYVVIPTIGLDHTEWLGGSLSLIAAEKAAIIKKGCRVFTAVSDPEAFQPIERVAGLCGAPLFVAGRDARCSNITADAGALKLDVCTEAHHYLSLKAPLTGSFHAFNMVLAVMVAEDAGVECLAIRSGLERMLQTGYRARLERVGVEPTILFDVSHNPDGMRATVNALLPLRHRFNRVFVMLGLASDKDARAVIGELLRLDCSFVVVPIPSERSVPPETLGRFCAEVGREVTVQGSGRQGLAYLRQIACPDDMILVTGSFYLAGDLLSADA